MPKEKELDWPRVLKFVLVRRTIPSRAEQQGRELGRQREFWKKELRRLENHGWALRIEHQHETLSAGWAGPRKWKHIGPQCSEFVRAQLEPLVKQSRLFAPLGILPLARPKLGSTVYSSQSTRAANRKAIRPQPTRQAKLVAWHLTFRVLLNFAAIPESNIKQACDFLPRYWRRRIVVADATLLQKDPIPRV